MKRRNADLGKMRRPIKRNKITEGIYGSTLLYLKFLLLWVLVILADFILEFRFEFLWPFYLLIRSVYDSFKYQGLAFSVFFVCIALTSDLICFFFIPVDWLFFVASTFVWMQYVWHTDKGVCLPTIILCMLFVYLEAAIRLKDLRHMPFHMDLCRPFAAHCIGYPVVTFGFGVKSYVGYRMRQRRQRDVAKENEFYMQLLQQALPVETTSSISTNTSSTSLTTSSVATSTAATVSDVPITSSHHHNNVAKQHQHNHSHRQERNGQVANGIIANGTQALQSVRLNRKSVEKRIDHSATNGTLSEPQSRTTIHTNGSLVGAAVSEETPASPSNSNSSSEQQSQESAVSTSTSTTSTNTSTNTNSKSSGTNVTSSQSRRNKERHNAKVDSERDSNREHQEYMQRLENDARRLRSDLQASRASEQELRGQLASSSSSEKSVRAELSVLQREYDELQSRFQASSSARAQDRQTLSNLERRVADERRARIQLEAQLASERKARKQEEAAVRAAQAAREREREREREQREREREQREREQQQREREQQTVQQQCSEQCRARRRELEQELQEARAAARWADERCAATEREVTALAEQQHDADILMAALSAMQDKNQHLENSLSAETRIKLDLFSALGEAKRLLEIRESLIRSHEKEIEELKGKIAQVLAVMPSDSFGSGPAPSTSMSRVRLAESPCPCPCPTAPPGSTLDPNATAYTPKGSLVVAAASTES